MMRPLMPDTDSTDRASRPVREAHRGPLAVALLSLTFLLPIAGQAWYSSLTTSRILFEELGEAVRNPFWVAHRQIYDGMSSNIGWYALLVAVYQVFGFSLFAGKVVRLVFHAISSACLLWLLVRWMGAHRAIVAFLVLALSPALLYFNTLQTTYGVDLQIAPVLALCLVHLRFDSSRVDRALHAALGLVVMIGCLMWPVCVLYVPFVALIYVARAYSLGRRPPASAVAIALAAGALPFLVALLALRNPGVWLYDPSTGSGVFRGGGSGFVGSLRLFAVNARRILLDVTTSGSSYYFDLPRPDLSGVLGLLPALTVVMMLPAVWRSSRTARVSAAVAIALGSVTPVVVAAAQGPSGLRRATTCLAAFYALYLLCWELVTAEARRQPRAWRPRLLMGALSLLLVHHIAVFGANARSLTAPVPYQDRHWFTVAQTPSASAAFWAASVAGGHALDCREVGLNREDCRYAEVYAAASAHRRWSAGQDADVKAYDLETGTVVTLSPVAWPRLR